MSMSYLSFSCPSCFFSSVLEILVGERGDGCLGLTPGAGLSRTLRRELLLDILVGYSATAISEIIPSCFSQVRSGEGERGFKDDELEVPDQGWAGRLRNL